MKNSIRIAVAAGLFAGMVMGPVGLRADEEMADQDHEMKVKIEALEEAVEGLTKKTDDLSALYIEGFADTRYDDERVPTTINIGSPQAASMTARGQDGIFNRRAEIKMNGNISPTMVYSLGFDFTELKLKDAGVEIKDIPFLPFVDAPDYMWSARVGQYRIPFGIVAQTSSSSILFSERPLLNGGKTNTNTAIGSKGGLGNNIDSSAPAAYTASKLVVERIMGVQFRQKVKYPNIINYELQLGAFNDVTEDQASGQNKISGLSNAFPLQVADEGPSYAGRLAIEIDALQAMLNNMMMNKNKLQIGTSYYRDSQNGVYIAPSPVNQASTEGLGAEFLLEFANKMLIIQSEFIHQNILTTTGSALAPLGVTQIREGFYTDLAVDVLPFLCTPEAGDSLQLLGRYEEQSQYAASNVAAATAQPGEFLHKISRIGTGLKWSYMGGKNHTSINYYLTAPDGMFGGDQREHNRMANGTGITAPDTLLIIQQQFAFETGKPK